MKNPFSPRRLRSARHLPLAAATGAFLAAMSALFAPASSSAADRPNLMVFLVDDMGVMDTSVPFLTDGDGEPVRYPLNDHYRTPGMERLAAQGIRFNQFYAMSVCSPTRTTLMNGQNAARHRVTNWIRGDENNGGPHGPPDWLWAGLGKGDTTLPGLLGERGYRTIHVGKGHFGPIDHEGAEPLNLGFDVNVGGNHSGAPGSYYGKENFQAGAGRKWKTRRRFVPHLEDYHGKDIFLSEALTLEAQNRVAETVEAGQPFYLYFAHYAVHAPFQSDPRFAARYRDSGKSKAAQAFATMIEGMDKSLGDMLDQFAELGIAEDTLVFFLGDNGSDAPLGDQHEVACAAPLRGKKGAHYEGGMRVPFIAAWAKPDPDNAFQKKLPIPAGAIQGQVASVEDIFPTLLDIAGAEAPGGHEVDGRPLRTLLSGKADPSRPEQFLMHYPHSPHRSNYFTVWRDGDWKVIYHALPEVPTTGDFIQSGGKRYQLFNLAEDPFESHDLAEERPEVLRRMMQGLVAQLKAHDALYPVDEEGNELVPVVPEEGEQPVAMEEGFESIFDGKALSGWAPHDGMPKAHRGGRWWVEDGVLKGTQDPPGKGGLLWLDRSFEDFILRLQVELDYPTDSGVFVRMGPDGRSHQITLDHRPGSDVGAIYIPFGGGTVHKAPEGAEALREGEWNDLEIRVEGEPARIRVWMNGRQVTDFQHTEKTAEGCPPRGGIGLQVHPDVEGMTLWGEGHTVRFRNLRIKEIARAEVVAAP